MTRNLPLLVIAVILGGATVGCERDTGDLLFAPPNTDPIVYDDEYGATSGFHPFLGSKIDALNQDFVQFYEGTSSLRATVPGPGDASGSFAGGAFLAEVPRNFTIYNALTFWAKSSVASTLNVAGIANDNTGKSLHDAEWRNIPLTTDWQRYVLPIPLPAKLQVERGLFFFAEGWEGPAGHEVWFDEIKYDDVDVITNPRPAMPSVTINTFAGAVVTVPDTRVTFEVNGVDQTIHHFPSYFTFTSSNDTVVTTVDGLVRAVAPGTAQLTASLASTPATGEATINVIATPDDPAPSPVHAPGDVISLFSDAYTDIDVDSWSAVWDLADVQDIEIDGDVTKAYTSLVFAGVEFVTEQVDATEMTHFHADVFLVSDFAVFKIKLVDFGADGAFGGSGENADSEHELIFTATTTPPMETGTWVSFDIPLGDLTRLTSRKNIAQLILSGPGGAPSTAFVDNIYFHK